MSNENKNISKAQVEQFLARKRAAEAEAQEAAEKHRIAEEKRAELAKEQDLIKAATDQLRAEKREQLRKLLGLAGDADMSVADALVDASLTAEYGEDIIGATASKRAGRSGKQVRFRALLAAGSMDKATGVITDEEYIAASQPDSANPRPYLNHPLTAMVRLLWATGLSRDYSRKGKKLSDVECSEAFMGDISSGDSTFNTVKQGVHMLNDTQRAGAIRFFRQDLPANTIVEGVDYTRPERFGRLVERAAGGDAVEMESPENVVAELKNGK